MIELSEVDKVYRTDRIETLETEQTRLFETLADPQFYQQEGQADAHEQPAHVAGDIVVLELPPGHADGAGDQLPLKVFVHSDVYDHKGGVIFLGFQPLGSSQETGVGIIFTGSAAGRRGLRQEQVRPVEVVEVVRPVGGRHRLAARHRQHELAPPD